MLQRSAASPTGGLAKETRTVGTRSEKRDRAGDDSVAHVRRGRGPEALGRFRPPTLAGL